MIIIHFYLLLKKNIMELEIIHLIIILIIKTLINLVLIVLVIDIRKLIFNNILKKKVMKFFQDLIIKIIDYIKRGKQVFYLLIHFLVLKFEYIFLFYKL